MNRIVVTFILVIILTACAQTPLVRFIAQNPEDINWPLSETNNLDVTLRPWGIFTIDEKVVLLYGTLNTPAGSFRSIILRSSNAGKHWIEVMKPEISSGITEIFMLENGEGWALAMWMLEGPGRTYIYHTIDYGQSWEKLSELPLYGLGGHSYPTKLKFTTGYDGFVNIYNTANVDEHTSCCKYITEDGGTTWIKTKNCYERISCDFVKIYQDVAFDQTNWRIEVGETIIVYRKLSSEISWTKMSNIPISYKVVDGEVTLP